MDDKQTFHYRPSVVVRMCKSLRKIFSISSRAAWCFGPGRFTQSETCCHFASISADCALHHHFVRPWASRGTGERFLPPDALWGLRFLSLNWKHSSLSCPAPSLVSAWVQERGEVQMEGWVVLREISPPSSPSLLHHEWLEATCIQQSAVSNLLLATPQNYSEHHHAKSTDLLLGYLCLECQWSSVDYHTASPHWGGGETGTAVKAMLILHLAYNKKTEITVLAVKCTPIPDRHISKAPGTLSVSLSSVSPSYFNPNNSGILWTTTDINPEPDAQMQLSSQGPCPIFFIPTSLLHPCSRNILRARAWAN